MPRAAWIAKKYGHPYKNGSMVGKNILALSIKQLYGFKSDEKFADFIWENGIAQILGYKRKPHLSLFSKTRKYVEDGAIVELYNELVKEKCKGKLIRLIAEDSKDIPVFYVKKDVDAALGVRTAKRREQEISEMTKNIPGEKRKNEKRYFIGYKLHLIGAIELDGKRCGLPLTGNGKTCKHPRFTAFLSSLRLHDAELLLAGGRQVSGRFRIRCSDNKAENKGQKSQGRDSSEWTRPLSL